MVLNFIFSSVKDKTWYFPALLVEAPVGRGTLRQWRQSRQVFDLVISYLVMSANYKTQNTSFKIQDKNTNTGSEEGGEELSFSPSILVQNSPPYYREPHIEYLK